jgi:DNA topoisomerase-2
MSLAKTYQQKTDKQHILDNPDTYIGSVEKVDSQMWVFDDASQTVVLKDIEYVPGLYKLFDEGIVNARDHVVRMIQRQSKPVTYIDTHIAEDGTITITNDGDGIDIEKHPENGLWIPEMIFGHLRTSTNYDKEEKRTVGGKNGFGFKLVLIWSTYGSIETVDHTRGLKYTQEFKNNLDELCPPKITKCGGKPYTKVVFKPDYARLQMPGGLSPDMLALLKKRVYDIGAVTDQSVKKVKISYNDAPIPVKNFQQYIDLYLGAKDAAKPETKRVYESAGERWEYAVGLSATHEFVQISFVNGICTHKGGKHVDYIMGQITRKLVDYIEKKKKVKVNASAIKEQLILFLRCDIENPAFDSQTKDFMNTPSAKFGSTCSVTDGFIEKVAKMGVMDLACSLTEAKENKLAKKTDGAKTKTVRGIPNLIDANFSGTEKSKDCILILCEGLSAMSGIVSGLSSADRNTIGIYPLKGKVLNVRGEKTAKISENKEIAAIKKILGLESGRKYDTMEDVNAHLRYGRIMVMTDQDLDGSHIKGLCINLFHSEWESLTKIPGFLCFMNTPILRARKGQQTLLFYNDGEYETWKQTFGEEGPRGWTVKYFKGLGTSTAVEFKEYFANKKIVGFVHNGEPSDDSIDKVFNKKRPDDRKTWLENYDKTAYLNTSHPEVSYEEFFDREMIHFSTYDCARSIPNMVDGLKTSQRKVLYSAFKRRMTQEIKVAQFSGYVSEHSAYHHGEASLNGAIVKMAQNFVGSNNIPLLDPNGQFGTRLQGGDDAASERYIFTQLNPLARLLFPEADDAVLTYLDDDGVSVEPEYYVPILPFCLVNGVSGIGTGFSTEIPSFQPKTLVQYIRAKLAKQTTEGIEFVPYYEGFRGEVTKVGDNKYMIKGKYEKVGEDKVRITELPIGTWTMPYLAHLEELMDGGVDKAGKKLPPVLKDVTNLSTELVVDITVQFPKGKMDAASIEKVLGLSTTVSTTNMHLFDAERKLHKYATVEEIIDDFFATRMKTFQLRKDALITAMRALLVRLSNRARYILDVLAGTVDLRKKSNQQVVDMLSGLKYDLVDGDYKYLIKMPMDSVTEEHVAKIVKEKADTECELERLISTTLEEMWSRELDVFETEYNTFMTKRATPLSVAKSVKTTKTSKK